MVVFYVNATLSIHPPSPSLPYVHKNKADLQKGFSSVK